MKRRGFLIGAAAAAATADGALAQPAGRTPSQILGPYYPVEKPADSDADLTQIVGQAQRAAGQIVRLEGYVRDLSGRPLRGVRIEIWQADANGRYTHRADPRSVDVDRAFQGYGMLQSDADGRYALTTVKPAPYPDDGAGGLRAPHIHFDVTSPAVRLVTQMYFPGEPLNDSDRILALAGAPRARLIAAAATTAAQETPLRVQWDIVLRGG